MKIEMEIDGTLAEYDVEFRANGFDIDIIEVTLDGGIIEPSFSEGMDIMRRIIYRLYRRNAV